MKEKNIAFTNHCEDMSLAINKFETCKHRSENMLTKRSCCSSNDIKAYYCMLKNIFPLSFSRDCSKCNQYEYNN